MHALLNEPHSVAVVPAHRRMMDYRGGGHCTFTPLMAVQAGQVAATRLLLGHRCEPALSQSFRSDGICISFEKGCPMLSRCGYGSRAARRRKRKEEEGPQFPVAHWSRRTNYETWGHDTSGGQGQVELQEASTTTTALHHQTAVTPQRRFETIQTFLDMGAHPSEFMLKLARQEPVTRVPSEWNDLG
mmetsp:Transcript_5223/g.14660  ORF Transcript_5223/g.14660 Transcript_5223/m.14660 type:complete len:187 (+) Transcript_5223:627-1187(+)